MTSRHGDTLPVADISILWLTAGLSCDGDTIAMTAATQPSLEDLLSGALPWTPKVKLYNPFLSPEVGDEFVPLLPSGRRGRARSLHPGGRRIHSRRDQQGRRLLGHVRHRSRDRPAHHHLRMDRPARAQSLGGRRGRDLRHVRRHPCHGGKPHRLHGPARLPRLGLDVASGIPIVCVPGCPVQPDNMTETLLYLLHQAVGRAPTIPLDEALRPRWLFGQTVHEGCDRGGYYEQGAVRRGLRLALVHREVGLLGTGGAVQRGQAGLDGRRRRLPERRRHLHRLHHAGLSRQVHAVHGPAAGLAALVRRGHDLRTGHPRPAPLHAGVPEQGARRGAAQAGGAE